MELKSFEGVQPKKEETFRQISVDEKDEKYADLLIKQLQEENKFLREMIVNLSIIKGSVRIMTPAAGPADIEMPIEVTTPSNARFHLEEHFQKVADAKEAERKKNEQAG